MSRPRVISLVSDRFAVLHREVVLRSRQILERGHELLSRPFVWTVPLVRQMDSVECGVACLLMVLRYHGCWKSMEDCRKVCDAGRDGVDATKIGDVARQFGFVVQSWMATRLASFTHCPLPAIVHWGRAHFVVLTHITRTHVCIIDPAMGRRWITRVVFEHSFSGLILTLTPGASFQRVPRQFTFVWWYRLVRDCVGHRDLAHALAFVLLCTVFLQLLALVLPWLAYVAIDWIIPNHLWYPLSWIVAGVVFVSVAHAALRQARATMLLQVHGRVEWVLTRKIVERVVALPVRYVQQRTMEDMLQHVAMAGGVKQLLAVKAVGTVFDGLLVTIVLMVLALWSPRIALLAMAIAAVQVVVILAAAPVLRRLVRRHLEAQAEACGGLADVLSGLTSLKIAGVERAAVDIWSMLFRGQLDSALRRQEVVSAFDSGLVALRVLAVALLLVAGVWEVLAGRLGVGEMVAVNALAMAFLAPIGSLVAVFQQWPAVRVHLERVRDVLEARSDPAGMKRLPDRMDRLDIVLDRVRFRYHSAAPWVIDEVSAEIGVERDGDSRVVAIVGKVGSGKSTLAKLLLGLHRPESGRITIAGLSLSDVDLSDHRHHCGAVLQDSILFAATLRENIVFGRPRVSEDDLFRVARLVELHDLVKDLPLKYDTPVFDAGSGLSGGQRQRVLLARALVHRPSWLVLDEAMSHVDGEGERRLVQRMREEVRLIILIGHRLSAVRGADHILVLDHGRVVESGTHGPLVAAGGLYARLVAEQRFDDVCRAAGAR